MPNSVEEKEMPRKPTSEKREGMLRELQDLRQILDDLYQKNIKLDEENINLKKEVREMKRQIGNVIDMMRVLREDLRKAQDILIKPGKQSKMDLVSSASV